MYIHDTIISMTHTIYPRPLDSRAKAKEALLNDSVCSWRLQSRNVLTSPTSQSELLQLPWHTHIHLHTHTHTHTVMPAHAHTPKVGNRMNSLHLPFCLLPVVRGVFPAVIVSRVFCIVSSPRWSAQDSSLSVFLCSSLLSCSTSLTPSVLQLKITI